jgi:hypothetical protein
MNPQPNTNLTRSSQPPPSRQTCQQNPLVLTVDDDSSSTESESDQLEGTSPLESEPDHYYSNQELPPENQLGLEEWERQRRRLHAIPVVLEPQVAGESELLDATCPT